MTSFRFFHAADIHLDSPLTGLAGIESGAYSLGAARRIRGASKGRFDQVDFFVIAATSMTHRVISRPAVLPSSGAKAGIPVFVLRQS